MVAAARGRLRSRILCARPLAFGDRNHKRHAGCMGFEGSFMRSNSADWCRRAFSPTMANRRIQDERGVTWDVWDVIPGDMIAENYDRRSGIRLRSLTPDSTLSVHPGLENGWLCFQSADERRRSAPIPADWIDFPDNVLRSLLDAATPVPLARDLRAPRPSPSPAE